MSSAAVVVTGDDSIVVQPDKSGFQSFEHVAVDVVLAISYNPSGKRLATASADHKIRIYDNEANENASLIDQWRAHDAEIFDVQWIPGPFNGHFATIAADNKIKIWREDPSQAPLSGRRFRCIFSQSPASHVTYTSFSFHAQGREIFLALFTQDGLLSLFEPSEPTSLASWRDIDSFYPFGRHARGTEPRFRLHFQQTPQPSIHALTSPHLPATTISLVTSALSFIKIYRALPASPSSPSASSYPTTGGGTPSYRLIEFLELELPSSPIINDIAWSPGCLCAWDVIAAACDDGTVRIVDVLISPDPSAADGDDDNNNDDNNNDDNDDGADHNSNGNDNGDGDVDGHTGANLAARDGATPIPTQRQTDRGRPRGWSRGGGEGSASASFSALSSTSASSSLSQSQQSSSSSWEGRAATAATTGPGLGRGGGGGGGNQHSTLAPHPPPPLPPPRLFPSNTNSSSSTATTPSGITAGLAGLPQSQSQSSHNHHLLLRKDNASSSSSSSFPHSWRESGMLRHSPSPSPSSSSSSSDATRQSASASPVWSVKWMFDGSAVASSGDDGEVVVWRMGVKGEWLEFSRTRGD